MFVSMLSGSFFGGIESGHVCAYVRPSRPCAYSFTASELDIRSVACWLVAQPEGTGCVLCRGKILLNMGWTKAKGNEHRQLQLVAIAVSSCSIGNGNRQ